MLVTLATRTFTPEPTAAALRLGALARALAAGGDRVRVLTSRLARLRARRPHTFVGPRSGYRTIPVTTSFAFAYARLLDEVPDVVVIVRRLARRLEQLGGWREESIVLPEGTWEHVLRSGTVEGGNQPLAEVVGDDPVVVLARVVSPDSQTDSDHTAQEAAR